MSLINASKNFFLNYLPDKSEVNLDLAKSRRLAAATWLSAAFPTTSTSPGTVFGDMYVTPRAFDQAAFETAFTRLLGDVDLSNIASGGAFNCDLASAFVGNFETEATYVRPSRGLLRLVFDTDATVVLPGDIQFQINGGLFTPDVSFTGSVSILRVGTPTPPYQNAFPLRQLSPTRFVAIIPVTGSPEAVVTQDTSAVVVRYTIDGLVSAVVDRSFISGVTARSLSQRAKSAQSTYATSNGTTRAGMTAMVSRLFPEVSHVNIVMPWDKDSMRNGDVILGGQTGIDVFVRSPYYDTDESQAVVFVKGIGDFLVAEVISKHPILRIKNIVALDGTFWEPDTPACSVYIQSTSNLAPLGTCAGTEFQRVFVVVSTAGLSDLQSDTSLSETPGYTLTVNYTTDPMIRYVSDTMHAEGNRTPGVDVVVRPFIPIVVSSMTVDYRARSGIRVNAEQATREIHTFVTTCGGDDHMSFARVCEIMTYARAQDVADVSVYARAVFSCATYILPPGNVNPVSDYTAAVGARLQVPGWIATKVTDLSPTNPFTDTTTKVAVNRGNMSFILSSDGIQLRSV
jgi:hypothetical protein